MNFRSVSIYFFAGDFVDVLERHERGQQQTYATHDEVARLIHGFQAAGVSLTIYSLVTSKRADETPIDGVRIVSLGAESFAATGLLRAAVANDDSDAIVAHLANMELLRAVAATNKRSMAVLANSYNRKGPKASFERHRVASLLNSRRFELVSNHCLPATEHLARIGVKRDKLIAWDIPHRFEPNGADPKTLPDGRSVQIAYAGSINEDKGVGDIIRAMSRLREHGIELRCSLAGNGDIEQMQALARSFGIGGQLTFHGLIGNADVFRLFRSADVVAVPSRAHYPEGFPLTMFEAIASRTPIVCSDHPMFRPVMKDGANASVFRAGDDAAMADAMRRVLTDKALYWQLSCNAPSTWEALRGPADWRTMLHSWVVEGRESPWLHAHMLSRSGPSR